MFPKAEKNEVKGRLKETGRIVTTRVSKDFGRFKAGERLEYGGFLLKVVDVKSFENLSEHPFLGELDDRMRKEIERFGEFDVVWMVVVE